MKKETVDYIRQHIDAQSVARYYGFSMPKGYPAKTKISSPLVQGDSTPSFDIRNDGKVFYCFSSGLNGDWFDFIAFKENYEIQRDFPKIVQIAAKIVGVEIDDETYQPKLTEKEKQWKEIQETGKDAHTRYRARQEILVRKGIDMFHQNLKDIQWGVVFVNGTGYMTLPMKDEYGRICGFQKANKRMEQGSTMGMFYERIDKRKPVYVVEGVTDYLSMIQMGYKNVVGIVSALLKTTMITRFLEECMDVTLILDADTKVDDKGKTQGSCAGANKAYEIMRVLGGNRCKALFISIGEKKDVNDVFFEKGREGLEKIMEGEDNWKTIKQLERLISPPETIDEAMLCDQFLSQNEVAYIEGQWWEYNEGIWEMCSKEQILYRLQRFIEDVVQVNHTIRKITNTLAYIQFGCNDTSRGLKESLSSISRHDNVLFLKNGKYHLEDDRFEPYEPLDYCVSTLNVQYSESKYARPEKFLKFLDDIFKNDEDKADRIAFIQEWFGYCCLPKYHIQKFLYITGSGGNGKGTLFYMLQQILGAKNYKGINLNALEGSADRNFGRIDLLGAYANILDDAPKKTDLSVSVLRSLTGEDPITSDVKNKAHVTFRSFAKIVIASNYDPYMKDPDDWIKRRLQVLRFNRRLHDEGVTLDPHMRDKLSVEKNEVFWWAMQGLKRLLRNDKFTEPASMISETSKSIQNNDYFGEFLENYLTKTLEALTEVSLQSAYADFKDYCMNDLNMKHIPTKPTFIKKLEHQKGIEMKDNAVRLVSKAMEGFSLD